MRPVSPRRRWRVRCASSTNGRRRFQPRSTTSPTGCTRRSWSAGPRCGSPWALPGAPRARCPRAVPRRECAAIAATRSRALPVPHRPGGAEQRRQAQRRARGASDPSRDRRCAPAERRDSGRGFDEAAAAGQEGLGLASMRERLRLIEGEFTVRSQPGQGTTIIASVPIPAARGNASGDSVRVA